MKTSSEELSKHREKPSMVHRLLCYNPRSKKDLEKDLERI